jgi:hypothetical protein
VRLDLIDKDGEAVTTDTWEWRGYTRDYPRTRTFICRTDGPRQSRGNEVYLFSPYYISGGKYGDKIPYLGTLEATRDISLTLDALEQVRGMKCQLSWGGASREWWAAQPPAAPTGVR